ncbi:glutathione S-transferase family protein [Luteimonas aestuarii]|uniref:Glutathione S-transferase family protein n=1 Tax=Luteimonas aestuarii TaxID=453837 RepID=A0A4R5TVH0_9GAMM|nr:glutathione S-transferase N-terminal domain-containing protein [Luteimonas aestuarii]TDK25097.1 glutathione S-transferase family protein [Luteimonas aestuarii]
MKLYTSPGACSLADHIALQWIGQPFEAVLVTREQRNTPEFLALNPAGAVPVFERDGWVLTQNAAILNYLADAFPDARLGGDGTPEGRAEVNRWLALLNADVHPAFHPYFGSTAWLGEDVAAKTKEAAGAKLRGFFERIDTQLAGKDWLVGDRSIADPYLFVVTRWAKGMKVDLGGLSNLAAHFERMRNDAGVQAALKAEGI